VLSVAARESIGHRVKQSRSVLHCEVEPEQLADPLVLRHGGQALVQQVLQTEVVSPDEKLASPQVGASVAHDLH
jgi:hypothetical protein